MKHFIQNVFPPLETREKKKQKQQPKSNKIKKNSLTDDIVSPSVIKLRRKGDAKVTVLKDWGCSGDRKSMTVFSTSVLLMPNAERVSKLETADAA